MYLELSFSRLRILFLSGLLVRPSVGAVAQGICSHPRLLTLAETYYDVTFWYRCDTKTAPVRQLR